MTVKAKFHQLSREDRLQHLHQTNRLSQDDMLALKNSAPSEVLSCADIAIENSLGVIGVPVGIVPGLILENHQQPLVIATEETSVLAALNRSAKWANQNGTWSFTIDAPNMLGHIAYAGHQLNDLNAYIKCNHLALVKTLNTSVAKSMHQRGGGVQNITLSQPDSSICVVLVTFNPCDAMGANALNQTLNQLQEIIQKNTSINCLSSILSNRMTPNAHVSLTLKDVEPTQGKAIASLSHWAQIDPNRAVTHNKGIMNAVEGMLLATGNDWRAVSSGCHAWASESGAYRGLSHWHYEQGQLRGTLSLPLQVGTVGGMTTLHPIAKTNMKVMNIKSRKNLSQCLLAAGLLQNLAALRALAEEGIVPGHMKLHINNIMQHSSLSEHQKNRVEAALESHLKQFGHVSTSVAKKLAEEL